MLINGKVYYYTDYCVAYVSQEIVDYYLSLIPKYLYVNRGRYEAHVTIVRKTKETAIKNWKYMDGETIKIRYEPYIYTDGLYFWLKSYSDDIGKIRKELGLTEYREGFDCYHITIGNIKNASLFCL